MSDILRSTNPNTDTGFMIYSAMLSMGSCIGYLLSAVDWQTFSQSSLCSSEQTAILIVLFLFTITLIVTMLTAKERPLKGAILMVNVGSLPIINGDIKDNIEEPFKDNFSFMTIKRNCRLTFIMACIVKVIQE